MKRIFIALLALFMITLSFVSCTETNVASNDTENSFGTESETVPVSETEDITTEAETEPVIVIPDYINPLTGLGATRDLYNARPVAIMINNLWGALPQEGIDECDIMYECLVEGGITRLMVLKADYASLGKIGSVRSCRHYYLDLAQNYDAIDRPHVLSVRPAQCHLLLGRFEADLLDARLLHE